MVSNIDHRNFCIELAKLVKEYPDILKFSLQYFDKNAAPWIDSYDISPTIPKRLKMSDENISDVLEGVLQHLQTFSTFYRNSWKWSEFIDQFIFSNDAYTKWLLGQCLTIVFRMCEYKRQHLISKFLSSGDDEQRCCMKYFEKEIIGKFCLSNCFIKICKLDSELKKLLSVIDDISDNMNISGIKLPIIGKPEKESNLVLVKSTVNNLRGLALAVAAGKPVCLCGPVGCGKTALVQHLALVTGHTAENRFYRIQLGEEMDSKLLLGSYKCTDVPGEFIWQPGVLTKAVINGDWLLFEDIDTATSDVVTLLVSLIERNSLSVPGYRDNITPAPGFQMFFTQRFISSISGYFQQNSLTAELLRRHWIQLNVEPLSKEELRQLIAVKFPILETISSRMVEAFLVFSVGFHTKNEHLLSEMTDIFGPKGRLTSTRDLMKWCSRSVIGYDVTSQTSALNVIQNAIDVFCCNVPDEDVRLKLATAVTTCLGVVKTKAEYFCKIYKPTVVMDWERCIAGRAILKRSTKLTDASASLDMNSKIYFAMTRPACCLMERVACCLTLNEPVLLVGETGTGKTSTLHLLAKHTGNTLVVLNMNQQSDSTDLLGGFKPVDVKFIIGTLRNEFEKLFRDLFNVQQNLKFLDHISNCYNSKSWTKLIALMKHTVNKAIARVKASNAIKKLSQWQNLEEKIERLEIQLKHNRALAFAFVEGALVRALQQGHWVLLDEINLASAETLQCLSGLLEEDGTFSLYEKGDFEPIKRHEQFRLMAAMNPATDIGKKQLPPGIRNRFTELYVNELTDRTDLITLVACYLKELNAERVNAIAKFYLKVRMTAQSVLSDGTGHRPHYSLRTLCRALAIVAANSCKGVQRSLYEGFCLSFLTQLDLESHNVVEKLITEMVVGVRNIQSVLNQSIPEPEPHGNCVCFEGYWVSKGNVEIKVLEKYILTPTVKNNLKDLVRVISLSNHPVLLQGDTSVGKTSLISYLASASGNKCLRINNHEHTDLQEYIGAYSVDSVTGQLAFKEGVLVEAMRHGYWIILDELNLAPSDVLEALNRVLDDNRELYIPETQTTVKADPKFRLFATQNPPGLYGGRKMLSRAFRNRFIELHFGEIPSSELEVILHNRCDMPASSTKKVVAVMKELQAHRKGSAAFAGKQGFITLRDLFRWGERYRLASSILNQSFYDWDQHIADEGFLVLAGRVRKPEEAEIVLKALEKHFKRKVDVNNLFTLSENTSTVTKSILETIVGARIPGFEHIVWTFNLRKLAVLVGKALEFHEPVLMVGETGCGKTTISQFISAIQKKKLFSVNCHQHSESSDFLGGLRPVRQHSENDSRLFEWVDGPLIEAMKNGQMFLADEISLGDDSVLERLNSLLEPERTLLLSEKASNDFESGEVITAHPEFHFLSTMNPGGDYGKKELSPALRNRLTEIWSESCNDRGDLISIIEHNIKDGLTFGNQEDGTSGIGRVILDFIEWFKAQEFGKKIVCSVRDILLWVKFINVTTCETETPSHGVSKLSLTDAYVHGAYLVFLDALGTGMSGNQEELIKCKKQEAGRFLTEQVKLWNVKENDSSLIMKCDIPKNYFGIPPFYVEKGDNVVETNYENVNFTFQAKTTRGNLLRLLRSLQLPGRALLLEGSPGVGKTSLVQALSKAAGYKLTRINLSEQTDVSDLFGADLPVDGADGGVFSWRDGPFLKALKDGHWILLDELNLASQSVLEGLNAVLDHRGKLFIPELGKTFTVDSRKTRLFACQNPLRQGGARKGLPASFLNRFTQVYMESLDDEDILFIMRSLHPELPSDIVQCMVNFNSRLVKECGIKWGLRGAPWEMNLRDMMRWCEVTEKYSRNKEYEPGRFVSLIYADRMRTVEDKQRILSIYEELFGTQYPRLKTSLPFYITPENVMFGDIVLQRIKDNETSQVIDRNDSNLVLRNQLNVLRSLAICIEMNWFVILVGNSGSGKTSIVQVISQLCNKKLDVLSVNSAMDTMDILGGFEQVDYNRHFEEILSQVEEVLFVILQKLSLNKFWNDVSALFKRWEEFKSVGIGRNDKNDTTTLAVETEIFRKRITALLQLLEHVNKHNYFDEKISSIYSQLKKLQDDIDKIGSINSGGKFEWVDSVLIKCITEGRWLLVENVNLCSPAILDRLNGLLEPGGVLTLGEKGVDKDGNLVTVVPHPNFRLFFTMDPQRGEISRAMRNRGLEISLQPIDGDLNDTILDLMAILHHFGITSHAMINTLLQVHFAVRDLNIGLDQLSVGHLIHACFLTVQHHRRYEHPISETFKLVCDDVYVKSRSLSYDQQEIVSSVIAETLYSAQFVKEMIPFYITLNTQNLQFDSKFYLIQQQAALPLMFAHMVSEKYGNNLSELMFARIPVDEEFKRKFDITNLNLSNLLLFSILKFYDEAFVYDVKFRHFWITQIKNCWTIPDDFVLVSEHLSNMITDTFANRKNSPWDWRRLPTMFSVIDDTVNKFSLSMNFLLLKYRYVQLDCYPVGYEEMDVNLKEYSQACISGGVPVRNVAEELIASQFEILRSKLDGYFVSILNSGIIVNEYLYELFLKAFQYYNKFVKAGEIPFFSRSSMRVNKQALNYLRIHFKWVVKWVRKLSAEINEKFDFIYRLREVEAFCEIVAKIEESSDFAYAGLLSFSKKLRIRMGQPKPREKETNEDMFDRWVCSNRSEMDFNNFRNYLCGTFVEKTDLHKSTEKILESIDDPMEGVIEFKAYKYPIDILPLYEAFYLKLEVNYKNHVLSKLPIGGNGTCDFKTDVHNQISQIVGKLKFIPSEYVSCIEKPMSSDVLRDGLYMNWFSKILKHMRSFSSFSYRNFLNYRKIGGRSGVEETALEHDDIFPFHYPVFSTYGTEFMFMFNEHAFLPSIYTPSMRNIEIYRTMLNQLKEFFWKNSAFISNSKSSFVHNEVQNIRYQFSFLIHSIFNIFNFGDEIGDLFAFHAVERVSECLKNFVERKRMSKDSMSKELSLLDMVTNNLKELSTMIDEMDRSNDNGQLWLLIGKCWTLIGVVQFLLFSIFEMVDPLVKLRFKKFDCRDDMEFVRSRLIIENISSMLLGYDTQFPYRKMFENWLEEIKSRDASFSGNDDVFIRDEFEKYRGIIKDVQQFKNSIGSTTSVYKLYSKILNCVDKLNEFDFKEDVINSAHMAIKECKAWLNSADQFLDSLSHEYIEYPDIVDPIIYAVTQVTYGVSILSSYLSKTIAIGRSVYTLSSNEKQIVQNICLNLGLFPRRELNDTNKIVDICFSQDAVKLLTHGDVEKLGASTVTTKLTSSCLKEYCGILSVVNKNDRKTRKEIWRNVKNLLDRVVYLWKVQEEKRQEAQQQEDSLYVFRTRTLCETVSEEEETKIKIKQFFAPSYDCDFDTENAPSEQTETDEFKKPRIFITDEEMTEICSVHFNLTKKFTYTSWMEPKTENNPRFYILDAFFDRYTVFAGVLREYSAALDEVVDGAFLPGAILMTNKAQKFSSYLEDFQDFYHNSDVEEVYTFYPVLVDVRNHTEELLKTWEDNPVLLKIIETVDRIMSFEVTSPVSRFLTGADVLLQKLHEWEEVAHAGVSFLQIYENLTGLIFKWRKMEISYWKNALDNVASRMKKKTSKWWFHLYSVCCQFLDDSKCSFKELIEALEKFIETASLGEFDAKLNLLFVFHCHYANLPKTAKLSDLCYALWNLHSYYKQFEAQISAHIHRLSIDVRKNLHNFVKITRWNDINYWSIMKTVEKTHEQLMKYIKQFQKILDTPVQSAMNFIPAGKKDCDLPIIQIASYLSTACIQNSLDVDYLKYKKFFSKAKKLCKSTVSLSKYKVLTNSLNDFVNSIHEDIEIINRMDIDTSLEKEKQRSQAKNLLQQKRKTMADLFKTLSRLGISYRTGIIISRNENFSVDFANLKPIDISLSYSSLPKCTSNDTLINIWDDCENNFLTSVSKQSQLRIAMQKPHQDLGPQVCDRVKGFAAHLLDITLDQKRKVIQHTENLYDLKNYQCMLPEFYQKNTFICDENVTDIKNKFIRTVHEVTYFFQQFLVTLECCPTTESPSVPAVRFSENDIPALYTRKFSPLWNEIYNKVDADLKLLEGSKNKLFFGIVLSPKNFVIYDELVTSRQFEVITEECKKFENILEDLNSIKNGFCFQNYEQRNTLLGNIEQIELMIRELILDQKNFNNTSVFLDKDDMCEKKVENLRKKILLGVQKIYKKCLADKENFAVEHERDSNPIKENHLRDELLKSLIEEIEILDVENVSKRVKGLMKKFMKSPCLNIETRKKLLEPLIPLLDQYTLLADYITSQYVGCFKLSTKLCSNLLSLFIDLGTKGFCIPSELLEEEGDEKTEQDKGGMGLVDGEGEKDVSEEIESQDQLEGAEQAGQEKKQDDEDCKEEEKGIEMSEDFGGKSQEIEKKDQDEDSDGEGDEDEDEDELDKEMGETGKEAETLDQQIWGSDSENEEEEGDQEPEGDDGRGEETGPKEMGAKDERTKEYEDGKTDDREQNEKEQQKEINEMDETEKDEDQVDPYHGKQDPLPEPEALDLPDDLQLDEGEGKDEDGQDEENPFDIDAMKDQIPPDQLPNTEEAEEQSKDNKDEPEPEIDEENDDNVGSKRDEEKLNEENGEEEDAHKEEETSDGGTKDDEKIGDEPKPEESDKSDEAAPTEDEPSENSVQGAQEANSGSEDAVNKLPEQSEQKPEEEKRHDTTGVEQQGVGKADEAEKNTEKGHSSEQNKGAESREKGSQEQKRKLRPGESDMNRSLAESSEPSRKRLKTMDIKEVENEEADEAVEETEDDDADLYQHIRESEKASAETIDAATKEQAEKQPVIDEKDGEEPKEDENIDMHESEEENMQDEIVPQNPDKIIGSKHDNKKNEIEGEVIDEEMKLREVNVEGDIVETMTVARGPETSFHTKETDDVDEEKKFEQLSVEYIEKLKNEVQEQLSTWSQTPGVEEASSAWEIFSAITSNLSQELSEQLRLVLEPTQASRLKGDFRTGRRINMRKVIPYIASQFRKDKIWLRRTKPAKREYQIILAIDDSSSMADNHSKELAFESVALVSKALSLIEAGELGVISFGEKTRILHPLGEPFTTQTGAKLIRDFTFDEIETKIADAVHTANGIFLTRGNTNRAVKSAQLLIIVSDGRGVTSEGVLTVKSAVRSAKQAGVFVVFIIIDNPNAKNSVLDIRMPIFQGNKLIGIQNYIDNFPFPFYLILRDIDKLPGVLSDALRQWFELVASSSE